MDTDSQNELFDNTFLNTIKEISHFFDSTALIRVINKLTDYAEILTIGKLTSTINYNYSLNSSQTDMVIELLLKIQALSKINILALKGTKIIEDEYISNILSDTTNPAGLSSYLNLKTALENRLSVQTQQYNKNMNKRNTTMAMPLNELRGHVRTIMDFDDLNASISTKAQHGIIAASYHDAYAILLNRPDYWEDRSYQNYFFSDDNLEQKRFTLVSKEPLNSLIDISANIMKLTEEMNNLKDRKIKLKNELIIEKAEEERKNKKSESESSAIYNDRMMTTPFGRQYGNRVDNIIVDILNASRDIQFKEIDEDELYAIINNLYTTYTNLPNTMDIPVNRINIINIVDFLLEQDYGIKSFIEKFIFKFKNESFSKFYTEDIKNDIDNFLTILFTIFFEEKFKDLFKIIRSRDVKTFACAFIIKRIYLKKGENLTHFTFFLIKTIGKIGNLNS